MKRLEHAYRMVVPSDEYLMLRLDGRAFHTYTRGLNRPYDTDLMLAMNHAMAELCREIDGVRIGYCQSDEISLVVTNWVHTPLGVKVSEPWLGGVMAKLLSVSASVATVAFNEARASQGFNVGAVFDSRLWTFPQSLSVEPWNYLLWRQRDAIKNSVSMAAQAHFSHHSLNGVNTNQKCQMLRELGHPWEDLPQGFRNGRICVRVPERSTVTYVDKRTQQEHSVEVDRSPFTVQDAPEIGAWLDEYIPKPMEMT